MYKLSSSRTGHNFMVQKDSPSVHPPPTAYDTVREAASAVSTPQPRTPRAPKPSDIVNPAASPTKFFRHLEDHIVTTQPSVSVGASKVPGHRDDDVGAGNGTGNVFAGESHVTDLKKSVNGEPTDDVFAGGSKVPDHPKNPVGADNGTDTTKASSGQYEHRDDTPIASPAPEASTISTSQNQHTGGALIKSAPAAVGLNKSEFVKPSATIEAKGFEGPYKNTTQISGGNSHQEPPGKKEAKPKVNDGACSNCSVC